MGHLIGVVLLLHSTSRHEGESLLWAGSAEGKALLASTLTLALGSESELWDETQKERRTWDLLSVSTRQSSPLSILAVGLERATVAGPAAAAPFAVQVAD